MLLKKHREKENNTGFELLLTFRTVQPYNVVMATRKRLVVDVTPEEHRKLRLRALQEDISLTELARRALGLPDDTPLTELIRRAAELAGGR